MKPVNEITLISVPKGLEAEQVVNKHREGWHIYYVTQGKALESVAVGSELWEIIEFEKSAWFSQSGTVLGKLPYQLWHEPTTELPTSGTHRQGKVELIRRWKRIVERRNRAEVVTDGDHKVEAKSMSDLEFARQLWQGQLDPTKTKDESGRRWTGLGKAQEDVKVGDELKVVKLGDFSNQTDPAKIPFGDPIVAAAFLDMVVHRLAQPNEQGQSFKEVFPSSAYELAVKSVSAALKALTTRPGCQNLQIAAKVNLTTDTSWGDESGGPPKFDPTCKLKSAAIVMTVAAPGKPEIKMTYFAEGPDCVGQLVAAIGKLEMPEGMKEEGK